MTVLARDIRNLSAPLLASREETERHHAESPRRSRSSVFAAVAVIAVAAVSVVHGDVSYAATPSPLSAAGIEAVGIQWIAVSPAFRQTGVVAAVGTLPNCAHTCTALWVSRDGGATWRRAAAHNWEPHRLIIAAGAHGRDVIFGAGGRLLMRSDDLGENFSAAGAGGMPTILPGSDATSAMVVASMGVRSDYIVRDGQARDVPGSGNTYTDLQFVVSPSFPSGGNHSPAFLGAVVPTSGHAVVLRCADDFTCSNPVTLSQGKAPLALGVGVSLALSEDYADHGSIFVDTSTTIEKSLDGGETFTQLNVVPEAAAGAYASTPMMALAPGYRESGPIRTAYVAVFPIHTGLGVNVGRLDGGIYKTSDGGDHWASLATGGPFARGGATAIVAAPDGRLIAGFGNGQEGGVTCSVDGGTTWQAQCPALPGLSATNSDPANLSTTAAAPSGPRNGTQAVLLGVAIAVSAAILASILGYRVRRKRVSDRD